MTNGRPHHPQQHDDRHPEHPGDARTGIQRRNKVGRDRTGSETTRHKPQRCDRPEQLRTKEHFPPVNQPIGGRRAGVGDRGTSVCLAVEFTTEDPEHEEGPRDDAEADVPTKPGDGIDNLKRSVERRG